MIHQFFGGLGKYDIWLTRIADYLARPGPAPEFPALPADTLDWINKPHEIVDHLLATGEKLRQWQYDLVVQDGLVRVRDRICRHIIEERPAAEINELRRKYGLTEEA